MDQLTMLRTFVTVVRRRSFSKAARDLGVSVGSVSRAISELESRVQTRLLHRTTRVVALTEDAKTYFLSCAQLLDELDEANRTITDKRWGRTGEIRLVAHSMTVPDMLPRLIEAHRIDTPDVRLRIIINDGTVNLLEGRFDMAILPPDMVDQGSVIRRTLICSRRILVASPSYLAVAPSIRSAADLAAQSLLLSVDHHEHSNRMLEMKEGDRRVAIPANALIEGDDMSLRACALAGLGIARVPEETVSTDLAAGRLQRVLPHCELTDDGVELCLFYPDREFISARCRALVDLCVSLFRRDHVERPALVQYEPELRVG